MKHSILLALVLCVSTLFAQQPYTPNDIEPNTVIVKVKNQYRSLCANGGVNNSVLNNYLTSIGISTFGKIYPHLKQPEAALYRAYEKPADLTLIYRLKYNANQAVDKVIAQLLQMGLFEYAEPNFISRNHFSPNDAQYGTQWYIPSVKADLAWNVWQGDTNTVIGITDSGYDTTHTDLVPNIKYNTADPIDGIDNDNDGYIDNFRGWNTFENSRKINDIIDSHGTFVQSLSSAATNNSVGMAGIGFKCKAMHVRVDDNTGQDIGGNTVGNYIRAYEGMVYAADKGTKVINCSWGNTFFSQYGQDVVTYCVINKDALVVASAGNSNNEVKWYPASYNYSLSVAGHKQDNTKTNTSTFNTAVDISAPGTGMLSAWNPNTFITSGGTSAAAPVVSGGAALVRSRFTSWSALKTAEHLKATADPIINTLGGNSAFVDKLGAGKLDLFTAISDTSGPAINILSNTVTDNNDNNFIAGDTLNLFALFKNYVGQAVNTTATISTSNAQVQILTATANLGTLNLNDSITNAAPFRIRLLAGIAAQTNLEVKVTITANGYSAVKWITILVNPNWLDINVGDVALTFTARGATGYNGTPATQGNSFRVNDSGSLLFNGGFMLAQGPNKVMDNILNNFPSYDNDWAATSNARQRAMNITSDQDVFSTFDDSPAGSGRIGVNVTQRGFGFANSKYIILEYTIRPTTQSLTGLYAGIFNEWELPSGGPAIDAESNYAKADLNNKLIYGYTLTPEPLYAGVTLLNEGLTPKYYAFNSDGTGGSINIFDGFSNTEKFNTLTGVTERFNAPLGNVAATISVGPFDIALGDSVKIAFAYVGGVDTTEIKSSAMLAKTAYYSFKWHGLVDSIWAKADNWNWFRLPDSTDNATTIVNPIHNPNINGYTAIIYNLDLNTGAVLSLSSNPNSVFKIKGNLSGAGSINTNAGIVEFGGTVPQIIGNNNSFFELKINNPTTVTNITGQTQTVKGPFNVLVGDFINKGIFLKQ